MRILFLAHRALPEHQGGIERNVHDLARGLGARGEEVSVLAAAPGTDRGGEEAEASYEGVRYVRVFPPPAPLRERALEIPPAAAALDRLLDRARPDVVHVHHLQDLSLLCGARLEARGVPYVVTILDHWYRCPLTQYLRSDLTPCPGDGGGLRCVRCEVAATFMDRRGIDRWRGADDPDVRRILDEGDFSPLGPDEDHLVPLYEAYPLRRRAARRFLSRARAVVVTSDLVRRTALREGIPPERIETVAPGVDPLETPPVRSDGPLRCAYVGSLGPHKGLHVLAEAFDRAGIPGAELRIHGGGDAAYARRLRGSFPPGTMRGPYDRADLPRILGEADVVLCPSVWEEAHSWSILEARAGGRGVLASRIGAYPELVREGVDGALLPPGDAGAWRAAVAALVADRPRVRAWAEAARRDLPRPAPAIDRHLEIYRRLITRPGSGA